MGKRGTMRFAQEIRERQANRRRGALTRAVWELPFEARVAMYTASEHEELIIGGYADSRGRVCPSVAAFRRGARSCVGTFPRAWDEFGQARRPRLATKRELEILRALLEESLTGPVAPISGPLLAPQPALAGTCA